VGVDYTRIAGKNVDRLSALSDGFLLVVTLIPFSTALLGAFIGFRVALVTYWLVILLLGLVLLASWRYAVSADLVKDDVPDQIRRAVQRRIVLAQTLYACAAALCLIGTGWSIACIFLLQLNYAIAPRLRWLADL
jgi:uncharacterized membrane protein